MLILIGLGLETKDISLRGLQAATEADKVLFEQYTSFISKEYLDYLKEATGQEMVSITREDMEEKAEATIKDAKDGNLAILVPGDPLVATTHYSTLIDAAHKMKIKTKVYHAASIYSAAVGESGLDVYKFGPPVTIAFWSKNYKPVSFLDSIKRNLENNHHTLLLLDIDQKNKRPMKLSEATELLKNAELERLFDIINEGLRIVILGNVGKDDQELAYVRIGDANKVEKRFEGKVLSLVVPAQLSFAEKESLERL